MHVLVVKPADEGGTKGLRVGYATALAAESACKVVEIYGRHGLIRWLSGPWRLP
jgi:hypothetical protein